MATFEAVGMIQQEPETVVNVTPKEEPAPQPQPVPEQQTVNQEIPAEWS